MECVQSMKEFADLPNNGLMNAIYLKQFFYENIIKIWCLFDHVPAYYIVCS